MKIVYRAGDILEAEIVKGLLIANAIEAHVSGFYLQGGIGETAPLDFAKVHVADDDFEKAQAVVLEYEETKVAPTDTRRDTRDAKPRRLKGLVIAAFIAAALFIFRYGLGA